MSCCGEDGEFTYSSTTSDIPASFNFPPIPVCGPCEPVPEYSSTEQTSISCATCQGLVICCDDSDFYLAPERQQPPAITSPLFIVVVPTVLFQYVITADNDPIIFFATTFPSWMTFDGVNTLSGIPPTSTFSNVFTFVVGASNNAGSSNVTIQGGIAPYVTSASDVSSTSGELFEYFITATNSPISFNAFNLPAWASFDGSNRVFGVPPILCIDAEYNFTVTATNIYGTSVNHNVTTSTVPYPAPDITSAFSVPAQGGVAFSYLIEANRDPVSYNAISLPAWLTFDGIQTVSGTPPNSTETDTFTAEATNVCATGSHEIDINITESAPGTADFFVIGYSWDAAGGTDLDTRTALTDLDPTYDFIDVGYCKNVTVGPSITPYLTWGGDNTSPVGEEDVLVDFKQMTLDYPSKTSITVRLRSNWFNTRISGDLTLTFTTYLGGTMVSSGTTFVNVGGAMTGTQSVPRNTLVNIAGCVDGDDNGTLVYDVATKMGTINPP